MSARVIFMLLAIVCFVLAALDVKPARGNLMAAGLAFWACAFVMA